MPTQQQIINKIAELEQWLKDNPANHPSRQQVMSDLRKAKQQLIECYND